MKWIAPWNVEHVCPRCIDGWVCEEHPEQGWPHAGCEGAGMPCKGLLQETAEFEREAEERLGSAPGEIGGPRPPR